jgi:RNA polymerase sigma-70 factor (family 1)
MHTPPEHFNELPASAETDTAGLHKRFHHLFKAFYNPLCKYAFSLIKDRSACEDIVQETFALIWEKRRGIILLNNIRYYLYTSVRNNCLTYLGKEQRLPIAPLFDYETEDTEPEDDRFASRETESKDYKVLLEKGIEQLPPKCKEVFLLSRMGKFSSQEIADKLGVSVKTVSNQLWRAMKILRAYAKNIHFW